ncbi:hypothetical protein H0H93_014936 [Arthromyces matolae]|nr:hypothetical protein H0H93_014936 [Arthromyces matolae]
MAEFATAVGVSNLVGAAASSVSAAHDAGLFHSGPCEIRARLQAILGDLKDTYHGLIRNADLLTDHESGIVRCECKRIRDDLFDSQLDLLHIQKKKRFLIFPNEKYIRQLEAVTELQTAAAINHVACLHYSSEGAARYSERKKMLLEQREARDAKKNELEDLKDIEQVAKFGALAKLKPEINVTASRRERIHNPFMGPDEATQAWQSTPELVRDRQSDLRN